MGFCPFFVYRDCPGDARCALFNSFGCEMIEKPGKPAVYTDLPNEPVDVYILQILSTKSEDMLIVYALVSDGTIATETELTKFILHIL